MRRATAWVVGLLAVAACGGGEGEPADVVLTLRPWFRDLRTVTVQAGADSLTLLLDTGGGASLIAPAVAGRIGCRPYGRDVGYRMTGEVVEFARCDSLRLARGGWSVGLAPIAVYDVNALLPPELPRLDGVLALDAFQGRVVTFDWAQGAIIVHSAASADPAARAALPIRPATGTTGRFFEAFVRIEGSRGPLWFLLDSGNLRGTLVSQAVLRDSLLPLTGPGSARIGIVGRRPDTLAYAPGKLEIDGALGTDFFRRAPVTLDLRPPVRRAGPPH